MSARGIADVLLTLEKPELRRLLAAAWVPYSADDTATHLEGLVAQAHADGLITAEQIEREISET